MSKGNQMSRGRTVRVTLSPDDFGELCASANRRNMTPDAFLRKCVHLMLCDRLVDAVMDDEIAPDSLGSVLERTTPHVVPCSSEALTKSGAADRS
jgi:hypothetical protein